MLRRHRADDTVSRAIARLIRSDLIVSDDIGMLPVAPDAAEALFRSSTPPTRNAPSPSPATWELAVFERAVEQGVPHPGFLMIDRPQKNLKPETGGLRTMDGALKAS